MADKIFPTDLSQKTTPVVGDKVLIANSESGDVGVWTLLSAIFSVMYTATATLTNKTLTSPTINSPTISTPSAFTTGWSITLAENTWIALDHSWSADGKWTWIFISGTAWYTQAFGDLVTLDKDDSRREAVDISVAAAATWDARGIIGIVVSPGTDWTACTVLLQWMIRADAKFPTLTIGAAVYASTSWNVVVTQPTTTDHVIRVVWFAVTADEMYFNPSNDYITRT